MLVVLLSTILSTALFGCTFDLPPQAAHVPGRGTGSEDTLVIAIADATASLDPAHAFENASSIIHKATYDTLVTFPIDSVDEIMPLLAESWAISEDGSVYTGACQSFASGERGSFEACATDRHATPRVIGGWSSRLAW